VKELENTLEEKEHELKGCKRTIDSLEGATSTN